jgi:hypothetical protein
VEGQVLQFSLRGNCGLLDVEGSTRPFHSSIFQRKVPGGPPPVPGELVRVRLRQGRVALATRIARPDKSWGVVVSCKRTHGFLRPTGWAKDLFFHSSEFIASWAPYKEGLAEFYVGYPGGEANNLRAYWLQPVMGEGHGE